MLSCGGAPLDDRFCRNVACDRTGTAFDCDRSLQSAQFLDPCKDERDEGGGFQRACPLDQEPATSVASTDAAQISIEEERSFGAFVPVAGHTRPDMQALLHRTPEGARIAVGGPPSMLSALGKELSKAGRPPFTRLTHAL